MNLFVHANIAAPRSVDGLLRRFLITPDMHRIHHSAEKAEQNTNFGVVFPWWDRIFGTYAPEPAAGQEKMTFGIPTIARERDLSVFAMLALPFRR